jgi:hypothetical protein
MRRAGQVAAFAGVCGSALSVVNAQSSRQSATGEARESGSSRLIERAMSLGGPVKILGVTPRGERPPVQGSPFDSCDFTSTWSPSINFANPNGQSVIVEQGFSQGESEAASFQLTPADFPLKIGTISTLLAGNTTVTTTTKWTVFVWSGLPNTGTLVYNASSDGDVLPHLVVQAGNGTAGVIQFGIDPGDPDQIIVEDNGTSILSIGFRIDALNQPQAQPCLGSLDPTFQPSKNVYPTVDADGLSQPANNWLNGLNCGAFGCPANGGWASFASLSSGCRLSGDWAMNVTWSRVNCSAGVGACCLPTGSCQILTSANCQSQGGVYQGDSTTCAQVSCPQPMGACCFGASCVNLTQSQCATAAGSWLGAGTSCASGNACPTGACCLPDGSCLLLTSGACTAQGGTFKGVGVTCAAASCPPPMGACCLSNGACIDLKQSDCVSIPGGAWRGAGTTCATSSCAAQQACYANCDGSTTTPVLSAADFVCYLGRFRAGDSYANCDGSTTTPVLSPADFVCYLGKFRAGCP